MSEYLGVLSTEAIPLHYRPSPRYRSARNVRSRNDSSIWVPDLQVFLKLVTTTKSLHRCRPDAAFRDYLQPYDVLDAEDLAQRAALVHQPQLGQWDIELAKIAYR